MQQSYEEVEAEITAEVRQIQDAAAIEQQREWQPTEDTVLQTHEPTEI